MCLGLRGAEGLRTQTEARPSSLGVQSCVWGRHWGSSFLNQLLGPGSSLAERVGGKLPLGGPCTMAWGVLESGPRSLV